MEPQLERRFTTAPLKLSDGATANGQGRTIFGYAALYGVRSQVITEGGQFVEVIAPGAFDNVLDDDVRALFNHDSSLVLARSKGGRGTLKLATDRKGLRYEFVAPDNSVGRDLVESMRRGDVDQSSFAFSIADGGDDRVREASGLIVRTIRKVGRLYDVSPVTYPAYLDASADVRAGTRLPTAGPVLPPLGAVAARFGPGILPALPARAPSDSSAPRPPIRESWSCG